MYIYNHYATRMPSIKTKMNNRDYIFHNVYFWPYVSL